MKRLLRSAAVAAMAVLLAPPAHAQIAAPVLGAVTGPTFQSWRPAAPGDPATVPARLMVAASSRRTRRVLIGGAIGAGAGLLFCTAVSTLADDSADGGISFCPLDTYLLIGGAGFLVGAAVGALS